MKTNGVGFFGLLFIALLVVKLTNPLAISWFWVFAPFTIPIGLILILGLIYLLLLLIPGAPSNYWKDRARKL